MTFQSPDVSRFQIPSVSYWKLIFFFQPSDFSRKSTSSDSGVVSPAENAEDQQLMQRPVKPVLSVQPEKKKETDDRYGAARKNTGRQTSGGSSNKNSGKQVCAPFGHKSPLEWCVELPVWIPKVVQYPQLETPLSSLQVVVLEESGKGIL